MTQVFNFTDFELNKNGKKEFPELSREGILYIYDQPRFWVEHVQTDSDEVVYVYELNDTEDGKLVTEEEVPKAVFGNKNMTEIGEEIMYHKDIQPELITIRKVHPPIYMAPIIMGKDTIDETECLGFNERFPEDSGTEYSYTGVFIGLHHIKWETQLSLDVERIVDIAIAKNKETLYASKRDEHTV